MTSRKPLTALKSTQAVSVDRSDSLSRSVSLVSDTVSLDSTLTLENLRLNPARLVTPPWSTDDTDPGDHDPGHQVLHSPGWSSHSPGCSETDSLGLTLNWSRVPYWDSSRSDFFPGWI